MHDVIVVGSGIFGSIIARHLRELGQDVLVVDDARPDSGSKPAGCVIRPSWVSSLSKPDLQSGLDLLDRYYVMSGVEFRIAGTSKNVTCYRVEPSSILLPPDLTEEVHALNCGPTPGGEVIVALCLGSGLVLNARRVVVAAGLWTPVLCPWVETWGRWGWSFRSNRLADSTISVWAPYRQVVAFNMDDGLGWLGDGSALIEKSATPEAEMRARHRCEKAARTRSGVSTRGVRPYAETGGRPCLISRQGKVWAVTGGAKNGTIAAAWAARELEREMGL